MFRKQNMQMEALLGNGFKANTLKGYKTSFSHVGGYLQKDYRSQDIDIRKIDHAFVTEYEFFLRHDGLFGRGSSEIHNASSQNY